MTRTFVPHDEQLPAIEHLVRNKRSGLWMPMGGGKSVTTLTALEQLDAVEQVYPALVLGPKRVIEITWLDEVAKWAHTAHLRVSIVSGSRRERELAMQRPADLYCMAYDNLEWLVEHVGDDWPFPTVVADECFPAGTLVDTPEGPRPIETIREGDLVETHAGAKPVAFAHKRFTSTLNLVCLNLSNGDKIHVTAEHPFFTDLGWLPARACGGRRLYGRDCLSDMSGRLSARTNPRSATGAVREDAVLRQGVPHQGYVREPSRTAPASPRTHEGDGCGQRDILELWEAMVRYPSGEDVGGAQRPQFSPVSGWERDRHVTDGSADSAAAARGLYLELRHTVGRLWAGLSIELQAGLRRPDADGVLGGGWGFPQYASRERPGQTEERAVTVLRVDSAPDHERGGKIAVFNLEVGGSPTYFAAGFLVHNCTKLKGFRLRQGGRRAGALGKVAHSKVQRFIGLTGTPAPNGIKDLWGPTYFIDKGERLGKTFSAFEQRWFRKGYDGYSLVPYDHSQSEVMNAISDIYLTVKSLQVDEPISSVIPVKLPPAVRAAYDAVEKDLFAEIEIAGVGALEIEAANAAVRLGKCLQIASGAVFEEGGKVWQKLHDAKLDALESIVEEANGMPVLVSYAYTHDAERVLKRFKQARMLDGPETIRAWNAGKIPVLVAHPASAGHGLNLQDGGNILAFFGLTFNLEHYMQIIERIGPLRQKQSGYDRPVYLYHIVAEDTFDKVALDRLAGKRSVQDAVLEYMETRK